MYYTIPLKERTKIITNQIKLNIENMYTEQDLVSFGIYMVSQHREDLINTHPEYLTTLDKEEAHRRVSHADLSNWRFLSDQTTAQIRADESRDDEWLPEDGTIMGEEFDIEEGE